jgi:hypothetical protein
MGSMGFFLIGVLSTSFIQCKTKAKSESQRVQEVAPAPESSEGLALVDEGEMAVVPGLAAGAVVAVMIAASSFEDAEDYAKPKGILGSGVLEAFSKLGEDDKKKQMTELVDRVKAMREIQGQTEPIKIAIVGAGGGEGHRSAAKSLENVLDLIPEAKALFQIVYVEPIPFSTDGWNKAMKAQNGPMLKAMSEGKVFADALLDNPVGVSIVQKNMQEQMAAGGAKDKDGNHILKTHNTKMEGTPDIVIQAEHVGTSTFQKIAKAMGAMHVVMPTDKTLSVFLDMLNPYDDVRVYTGYDYFGDTDGLKNDKNLIERKQLQDRLRQVGYPVRDGFLDKEWEIGNEKEFKEAKARARVTIEGILEGVVKLGDKDKTVLLMEGGAAANREAFIAHIKKMNAYAKTLGEGETVHLVIAQGFGKLTQENLEALGLDPKLKVHIKDKLDDKQIAALTFHGPKIGKSGGGSFAEGLYMACPTLYTDDISQYIGWERDAYKTAEANGWGSVINSSTSNEDFVEKMKKAFVLSEDLEKRKAMQAFGRRDLKSLMPYALFSDFLASQEQDLQARNPGEYAKYRDNVDGKVYTPSHLKPNQAALARKTTLEGRGALGAAVAIMAAGAAAAAAASSDSLGLSHSPGGACLLDHLCFAVPAPAAFLHGICLASLQGKWVDRCPYQKPCPNPDLPFQIYADTSCPQIPQP